MNREKQASSRDCFVCGVDNSFGLHLKFYQTNPSEVSADFISESHFQGYPGLLHGGITAAILDETAGRALMGIDQPRFMVTAKLEVKYRKKIVIGQRLKAVGRAVKDRGRIAESWSGIYNAEGELLAEAAVILSDIPTQQDPKELERMGWKVYPDPK